MGAPEIETASPTAALVKDGQQRWRVSFHYRCIKARFYESQKKVSITFEAVRIGFAPGKAASATISAIGAILRVIL